MVKIILIKSPDEWETTKQNFRDELVGYLSFSSHIYTSHCIYIYIYICVCVCVCVCVGVESTLA